MPTGSPSSVKPAGTEIAGACDGRNTERRGARWQHRPCVFEVPRGFAPAARPSSWRSRRCRSHLRRGLFFHELDLAASGAGPDQIAEGLRALFEGPGLLVAGTTRVVSGPAGFGNQLVAREFYTRVEAGRAPGTCDPASPCPAGEFCEQVPGTCGRWEQPGVCTPMGEVCPTVVDPVCGCDGVTYGNDCMRRGSGVSLAHSGPCAEL
jgi:hypothetical protein